MILAWKRIKNILPTGNEGTLTNYYTSEHGIHLCKNRKSFRCNCSERILIHKEK
jgi:hypothetical protein